MIIKKVSFDCTIAMPGYSNVKPGIVEADLEPGETIEQAWSELNRRAIAWHKTEYPHLYLTPEDRGFKTFSLLKDSENVQYGTNAGMIPTISKEDEKLEIDIDNCQHISELRALKDRAIGASSQLIEYYNQKVKELNGDFKPTEFTEGLE